MTRDALRVALVGVDGSGKSSVVARLRARSGPADRLVTIHAPEYHQHPDAPLASLSRQMHAVSRACDALRLTDLKAAVLYLQMTMYGPVERALVDAFDPRIVVSDRHAIVDTFAYGEIYRRLLDDARSGTRGLRLLRSHLGRDGSDPLAATADLYRLHLTRLGSATDLADLGREVLTALDGPAGEVLRDLGRRYSTGLPDVVVMLDVDPEEAAWRCATRDGATRPELHESCAVLEQVREAYLDRLARLAESHPQIRVHRIDAAGLDVDGVLGALIDGVPEIRFVLGTRRTSCPSRAPRASLGVPPRSGDNRRADWDHATPRWSQRRGDFRLCAAIEPATNDLDQAQFAGDLPCGLA